MGGGVVVQQIFLYIHTGKVKPVTSTMTATMMTLTPLLESGTYVALANYSSHNNIDKHSRP